MKQFIAMLVITTIFITLIPVNLHAIKCYKGFPNGDGRWIAPQHNAVLIEAAQKRQWKKFQAIWEKIRGCYIGYKIKFNAGIELVANAPHEDDDKIIALDISFDDGSLIKEVYYLAQYADKFQKIAREQNKKTKRKINRIRVYFHTSGETTYWRSLANNTHGQIRIRIKKVENFHWLEKRIREEMAKVDQVKEDS